MKPNYYALLLSFTFIFSIESRSQAHCSTILTTTTPTISAWDWRAQVWQTNIYSYVSGVNEWTHLSSTGLRFIS
jgi:hypothetical protein